MFSSPFAIAPDDHAIYVIIYVFIDRLTIVYEINRYTKHPLPPFPTVWNLNERLVFVGILYRDVHAPHCRFTVLTTTRDRIILLLFSNNVLSARVKFDSHSRENHNIGDSNIINIIL